MIKNKNIKAWLGFNLQDTLINIGGIIFLIGFFLVNSYLQFILFGITFMLTAFGLFIYFKKENKKISKATVFLNKWGSLLIVLFIWCLMVIKIKSIFIEKNKLSPKKNLYFIPGSFWMNSGHVKNDIG